MSIPRIAQRMVTSATLLVGCSSAVLSPAPAARVVPGEPGTAYDSVAKVRILVHADAWQGDPSVLGHVQALRVTIDNRSDVAIRVQYGDFALVSTTGRRSPALPPFRVEGELLSPALAPGFAVFASPGFSYRRFYVAPYFSSLYPGVPVYRRSYVFYDPTYYAFWYSDFRRAVRPSVEVLALALPEGVIEPDGRVSGFLYFRPVDTDAGAVTFRARIVSVHDGVQALGGAVLGEAAIPFLVGKRR